MDEDEYEIGEEWTRPSRRLRKVDAIILGLGFVQDCATAVANVCESAGMFFAAHANWQVDREVFHEEAALEIESLTTGEDE